MFDLDAWTVLAMSAIKMSPWWIGLILILAAQARWERQRGLAARRWDS